MWSIYLKSPLGCLLLLNFLNGLKKICSMNIERIQLNLLTFDYEREPTKLNHNFESSSKRESFFDKMTVELGLPDVRIKNVNSQNDLPHYRYFEFSSDNLNIIIRPDGGIENGWMPKGYSSVEDSLENPSDIKIFKISSFLILYTIAMKNN